MARCQLAQCRAWREVLKAYPIDRIDDEQFLSLAVCLSAGRHSGGDSLGYVRY